jgi:glycosyltransferase involved in cell wall biosynthesis
MKAKLITQVADTGGCGFYRMVLPGKMLAALNLTEWVVESNSWFTVEQLARLNPSHVIVQRQTEPSQYEAAKIYHAFGKAQLIYELDDLLWEVPTYNTYRKYFKGANKKVMRGFLSEVDRVVVSTKPLADQVESLSKAKPVIMPNMIAPQYYKLPRNRSEKLKVGWAGSSTHKEDLRVLEHVVRDTWEKWEWHFLGYVPPFLKGKVVEHKHVHVFDYMNALDSLQLDVALAPLKVNLFNECKSNLKLIEFGAIGVPVITTNVYPYKDNPCIKIRDTPDAFKAWRAAIESYDKDETLRKHHAMLAYAYASNFRVDTPSNVDLIKKSWLIDEPKASHSFLQGYDLSVLQQKPDMRLI